MKANELRIGNIVSINNREYHPNHIGKMMIVVKIDSVKDSISLNSLDEMENITIPLVSQLIKFIEPIPLTEKLLLRCGFKFQDNDFWIKDSNLNPIKIMGYDSNYYYSINILRTIKINYLHELQNLYFVLNDGQELTIK